MPEPPRNTSASPLLERLAALEEAVGAIEQLVVTRGLVVLDPAGNERLSVKLAEGTLEVLVSSSASRSGRDGVLLFSSPAQGGQPAGFGLQLWRGGEAVYDLSLWEEEGG